MTYQAPPLHIVHAPTPPPSGPVIDQLRDLDPNGLVDVISAARDLLVTKGTPGRRSGRAVMQEFALRHNILFADLVSPARGQPLAALRQACMWEVRTLCPHLSFPAIGRLFGGRDHSTIVHGVQKHAQRMAEALAAE